MTIKPDFAMAGLLIAVFLFNLATNRYLEWTKNA